MRTATHLLMSTIFAAVFAPAAEAFAEGRACEPAQIVGGGAGYCVIRNDGRVACWGDELHFLPYSPAPAGRFRQVSVGSYAMCGVREDGSGACWGKGVTQEVPDIDGEFQQLSAGLFGIEAILPDGTLDYIPIEDEPDQPVSPGTFAEVSDGCDRRSDGTLDCPDGVVPPPGKFERVAGSCAIAEGGTLQCWGASESLDDDLLPNELFRDLSSSSGFSPFVGYGVGLCAVTLAGEAYCRGESLVAEDGPGEEFRQVAYGYGWPWGVTMDGRLVPWKPWPDPGETLGVGGPVVGSFVQITAGGDGGGPLSCGLEPSGRASCWGNDRYGQASVPGDVTFTQVGAGPYHGCGLRTDETIQCWGLDDQLKDTDAPSGQFSQISIGYFGPNCALRTNGTVACWGYRQSELDVPDGTFVSVAATGERACAMSAAGIPTCWRYVEGDKPFDVVLQNVAVPAGTFAEVQPYFNANATIQDSHFCGRRTTGTVECWTDENGVEPFTPPAGKFTKLSSGGGFACGIRSTGHVECWGPEWLHDYLSPPEGEFVQAVAGAGHVCGLTADGDVVCTGSDQSVSICGPSLLCGNGDVDDSESCDDGDTSFLPGDACTAGCWRVPCGQPVHPEAEIPLASDALFALRAAVGSSTCSPSVCDVDASAVVTAADALAILRRSVGSGGPFACESLLQDHPFASLRSR